MSSGHDPLTVRPKKLSTAFWNANREALTKPSHPLHSEASEQFTRIIDDECLEADRAPYAEIDPSGAFS